MEYMLEKIGRYKHIIITGLFCGMLLLLGGCGQQTAETEPTTAATRTASLKGVVTQNDTQQQQLTVRDLGSDIETVLEYTASSQILDKNQVQLDGEQVETGMIMEFTYDPVQYRVLSADVPEDVWEYQQVDKFSFDTTEKSMQVAGKKYQYLNQTFVGSSGQPIELMELNKQDELTVRGVGYKVYSIVRTTGHGYIRLQNYADFTGGMVEVGNGIILPLNENMLITAREGTYRVMLVKGSATAVKTATVQMDQETTVDFSDYQPAVKEVGKVTFQVEPDGADLTINGTAVDYSEPLTLSFGTYRIKASMTGYSDYSGTLDVEDAESTVHINLADEKAQAAESATSTPQTSSGTSGDTENVQTKKIDSSHTITVSAPEGAQVYLDNVYKGLAPCTFTKVIGSQTLTLSRDGYITKSYSVDILDDDQDVTLKFSELTANGTAATELPDVTAAE